MTRRPRSAASPHASLSNPPLPRVEPRRRLVEQEDFGVERQVASEAHPLELTGEPAYEPAGEVVGTDVCEAPSARLRISAGGVPMFARSKATSFSTRAEDDLVLRILNKAFRRFRPVSRTVRRVSSPATSTRPAQRPPRRADETRKRAQGAPTARADVPSSSIDSWSIETETSSRPVRPLPDT